MDASSNRHLSPSTPKFSASGESNENSQNKHQMGSNSRNQKKTRKPRFMSPTISAASKAVVPKKKILTERNEYFEMNFSNTHVQKTPDFDSKRSIANLGIEGSDDSSSLFSDFDEDEENTFVPNSSSLPYDPFKNYLSPRPKFLRYKPNRRREILLRHGNGVKESQDGLNVDSSVSIDSKEATDEETSTIEEGSVMEEDKEIEPSATIRSSLDANSFEEGSAREEDKEIVKSGTFSSSLAANSLEESSVREEDKEIVKSGAFSSSIAANSFEEGSVREEDEESVKSGAISSSLAANSLEKGYVRAENEEIEKSEKGSEREEDETFEGSDDEIEEEEEERGWNLKGVLKTLGVFTVLVLSTLYISSLNSPIPSPHLQDFCGLKSDFWINQSQIVGAASLKSFESRSEGYLNQSVEMEFGLLQVKHRAVGEITRGEHMAILETGDELGEVAELKVGESEVVELQVGESEVVELQVGESEVGELLGGENEDVSDNEMQKAGEVSDHIAENVEMEERENAEKIQSSLDNEVPIFSDQVDYQETMPDIAHDFESGEVNADTNFGAYFNEEVTQIEADISSKEGEVVHSEMTDDEDSNSEVINFDAELNSAYGVVEKIGPNSILKYGIGASTFLAVVASLILGFHFKHKKNLLKGSSLGLKPCHVIAEKRSSEFPRGKQEHNEKKVHSFGTPSSSSIRSLEEGFEEFTQSRRAPKVELLGEFMVGEVSSSMKESRIIEREDSYSWVSQEKRSWIKAQSVSIHTKEALSESEFSAIDSPSYGSFTAEKMIVKKLDGRDGEEIRKVVTTPVRRSSRIRNRAVMSP